VSAPDDLLEMATERLASGATEVVVSDPNIYVDEVISAGTGRGFADFMPVMSAQDLNAPLNENRILSHRMTLFGLTPDGLLTFGDDDRLTWAEFVRAVDAGLIQGDPTNLVVYVDRGAAGGGSLELLSLVDILWQNREQITFAKDMTEIAVALGVATLRKPYLYITRDRARQLGADFRRRGYATTRLMYWVDRHGARWDAKHLAERLGLTERESSAMLQEMGWRTDEFGLFVRAHDPEAIARRAIVYTNGSQPPDAGPNDPIVVSEAGTWWEAEPGHAEPLTR
jgi:hypothetical protein